jgi:AraC-like DNA-binding protein
MARVDTQNIARYWWDRHAPGLSLMHADFRTQEFAPHRHEALVVAATELGGSVVKSRGVAEQADASMLFVFNPGEPHAGWMGASPRWRYRSFYLEQTAIEEVARGLGLKTVPYFTRNQFSDRELVSNFLSLHRALEDGRDSLLERELLISSFGMLFARHGSGGARIEPAPRDRARLKMATEYIHARLAEPLSLGELCASLEITQYQLIRLFKCATGLTPHAYITQLRLDTACSYLADGRPIGDTAIAAGFYDQSALTHHFKRCYGVTPLQFARAVRA